MQKSVQKIVDSVNTRSLRSNTQRVLVSLLRNKEGSWMSRASFGVPHATSRIRDLRTKQYGGFTVEMRREKNRTFYRLDQRSVTADRVRDVLCANDEQSKSSDKVTIRPARKSSAKRTARKTSARRTTRKSSVSSARRSSARVNRSSVRSARKARTSK